MQKIGGRPLCNLRLSDIDSDIDLLGGREEELQQLTERLENCCWLRHGNQLRQKQHYRHIASSQDHPPRHG